jgi:predicted anti-sigma-YlaC factor YlaD
MSQFRSERRTPVHSPVIKAADCPCVADLIDFAGDRVGPEERRRIETHLQSTNCPQCRSWISRATADPATPEPPFREAAAPRAKRPAEDTAWRKEAFLDLEQRLRSLDEE